MARRKKAVYLRCRPNGCQLYSTTGLQRAVTTGGTFYKRGGGIPAVFKTSADARKFASKFGYEIVRTEVSSLRSKID
jgi:hypothetical protein